MEEEKNYVEEILKDGAILLSKHKLRFPKELTLDERINFLQKLIKYFEHKEEYLLCASLEKTLYKQVIKQKQDSYGLSRIKNSFSGSSVTEKGS
jgi:hypothetical protein